MKTMLRSAAPRALFVLVLALLVVSAVALGWQSTASGSSHREAPLVSKDPSIDLTDVYAFVSPDKTDMVTLIANWIPFEEPAGGPNFYHFDEADLARYWIKVDNNGDAVCDIGFLFTFNTEIQNGETFLYNTGPVASSTDSTFNYRQTYDVVRYDGGGSDCEAGSTTLLAGGNTMPPDYVGKRSTKPYSPLTNGGVFQLNGGGQVYAGQRDDPFFVDIGAIFDLGGLRPFNANHVIPLKNGIGRDNVAGFNIHTTAMQLAKTDLVNGDCDGTADDSDCVIGVWSTAERASVITRTAGTESGSGPWVQVSRLGNPLVNEVVLPLALKDAFNGLDPSQDYALYTSGTTAGDLFQKSVLDPELGRLIPVLYPGIETPDAPRDDLQTVFLTGIPGLNEMSTGYTPAEYIRLNTGVAPTAGVCAGNPQGVLAGDNAGWPNGRRLEDDVTDQEIRAVAGGYAFTPDFNHAPNNALSDGVTYNDRLCLGYFPYMADPWSGYKSSHATKGNVPPIGPAGAESDDE